MNETESYNIGISYASENEDIAKQIVAALRDVGLTVFFDQDELSMLTGRNLIYTLPEIYLNRCEYCLMLISQFYSLKTWTNYEREALFQKRIQSLKENIYTDCMIPVFIDDTKLEGLNSGIIGFDIRKNSPENIAAVMYEKIHGKKCLQSKKKITISDIFEQIFIEIKSFLEKKNGYTYTINKHSSYDVVIELSYANYNRCIRLALDNPNYTIMKIYLGEVVVSHRERIWDAEIFQEENKIYFVNYNLSALSPGIPHSYPLDELSSLIVHSICNF